MYKKNCKDKKIMFRKNNNRDYAYDVPVPAPTCSTSCPLLWVCTHQGKYGTHRVFPVPVRASTFWLIEPERKLNLY